MSEPEHLSDYAGWVRIGRGVVYVGPDRASALEMSDAPEVTARDELATSLDRLESERAPDSGLASPAAGADGPLDVAEDSVAVAKDLTTLAERADALLRMLTEGADPKTLTEGVETLAAAVLDRYHSGRYRDALRLAHVSACVLALAWRWRDLVRVLDVAAGAARAVADAAEEAWALHELGTLAVVSERGASAHTWLSRAEELFRTSSDSASADLSARNLRLLERAAPPSPPPTGVVRRIADWPTRTKVVAGTLGAAAGLGIAAILADSGPDARVLGFSAASDTAAAAAFDRRDATQLPDDATEPGGTIEACDPLYLVDYIDYNDMERDADVVVRVSVDGQSWAVNRERWRGPEQDVQARSSFRGEDESTGEPIPNGLWRIAVAINGETHDEAEVTLKRAC
jgi:hypothetical protein